MTASRARRSRAAARRSIPATASAANSAKRSTTAGRAPRRRRTTTRRRRCKTTVHDPAGAHDHRAQRLARHSVHAVDQPVPGLRARLHLLLRAADARLSRSLAGPRLRDQALRQAQCRGAAARRAREAGLRLRPDRARHQHRSVPADRARVEDHARRSSKCSPRASIRSSIVTKSALVERDLDLLAPMAAKNLARVYVSITTLDRELARTLEPRAAAPQRRLAAIKALADAGVPVGVMAAPVIPQLTDQRPRGDPRGGGGARRDARRLDRCCGCRSRSRRCSAHGSTRTTRCAPRT